MHDVTEARKTICSAVNCVSDDLPNAENKQCIGFLLVAEMMGEDKDRCLHVISGMANGDHLIEVVGHAYLEAAEIAYYGDDD